MTADWHSFFGVLAQVSITAFAVMLATLQIGAKEWKGSKLKQVAAALALLELLIPLLAALIAAMPGSPLGSSAWTAGYVVMGLAGLVGLGWHVSVYFRYEDTADQFDDSQIHYGLPFSTVVYICLILFACKPGAGGLYGVGALSVWLIFSGSSEAWLLLRAEERRGSLAEWARTDGDVQSR